MRIWKCEYLRPVFDEDFTEKHFNQGSYKKVDLDFEIGQELKLQELNEKITKAINGESSKIEPSDKELLLNLVKEGTPLQYELVDNWYLSLEVELLKGNKVVVREVEIC